MVPLALKLAIADTAAASPTVGGSTLLYINMTSASLQPVNIQRLLKENNRLEEAAQYAQSINKGSTIAAWHACGPALPVGVAAAVQQQEALLAKQELQNARKMRLKQLLERERLAWEAELRDQGLSLNKHRP